ncbi:MAG: alpha-L-rhamnosidase, partial [Cytophagaceae bacterium]
FQDPGMNSFNHYSLGSCGEWLYRTAAGIGADPATPGYKKVIIRPETGSRLTSVQAKFHSIRGRISSEWRKYEGGFVMQVEIPANATAEVHVPAADAASVPATGATTRRVTAGLSTSSPGLRSPTAVAVMAKA